MRPDLKTHLKNQLRLELESSCLRAGAASFVLLIIYQFAIHQYFTNTFPQYVVIAMLSLALIVRQFLPLFKKLNDEHWLNLHTFVIAGSSVLWSVMLSNIALTESRTLEMHIITTLLFIGMVAAAAFSLAISKRDFYAFVLPLISMQVATFFLFNYDLTFKIAANMIAGLFLLFLGMQRSRVEKNWRTVRVQHFELQQIVDAVPGGISVLKDGRYSLINKYVRNRLQVGQQIIGEEFSTVINKDVEFATAINAFGDSPDSKVQFEVPLFVGLQQRHHLISASKVGREIIISTTDTHDLKKAQSSLVHNAKMASLGEMSSGLSHEINNPVAIISMRAQQMQMNLKKGTLNPETFNKGLEIILNTADRIARIAKGLRSFSQTRDELSVENANVKSVIEDALTLCREKFKNSRVELKADIPELYEINCNPNQISQVILNALTNSFDAISTSEQKWISIRAFRDKDFITISIGDSGPGIPAELRDKVMQPFFTTKEIGKGTGLGLSISKGIVESHKGLFYFNFEEGQPTELRISIPEARKQAVG